MTKFYQIKYIEFFIKNLKDRKNMFIFAFFQIMSLSFIILYSELIFVNKELDDDNFQNGIQFSFIVKLLSGVCSILAGNYTI